LSIGCRPDYSRQQRPGQRLLFQGRFVIQRVGKFFVKCEQMPKNVDELFLPERLTLTMPDFFRSGIASLQCLRFVQKNAKNFLAKFGRDSLTSFLRSPE
jgi:hypothetical protein